VATCYYTIIREFVKYYFGLSRRIIIDGRKRLFSQAHFCIDRTVEIGIVD